MIESTNTIDVIMTIFGTLLALIWETTINRGIGLFLKDRKNKFIFMVFLSLFSTILYIKIKKYNARCQYYRQQNKQ